MWTNVDFLHAKEMPESDRFRRKKQVGFASYERCVSNTLVLCVSASGTLPSNDDF
jgi:hypothetical protein